MKKLLSLLLAFSIIFCFAGCAFSDEEKDDADEYLKRAEELVEEGDLEGAIKVLERGIRQCEDTEELEDYLEVVQAMLDEESQKETAVATTAPPETTAVTIPSTGTYEPEVPYGVNLLGSFTSEDMYRINVFLSNFSEQNFKGYPCSDRDMVDFGFIYAKINNGEVFYSKDGYYCVDKVDMDSILKRFFGKTAGIPESDNHMHYSDGTYYCPAADGESYAYCSVATSMVKQNDGTYQVEFAVYANVNPHDSMSDFYRMTSSQAAFDSRLVYQYSGSAVVRDYVRSNGVESYQLISYTHY